MICIFFHIFIIQQIDHPPPMLKPKFISLILSSVISLLLNSCTNSNSDNEVILRDYTIAKIKDELKGDWVDSARGQFNKNRPSFVRFDYFSDVRGTFDHCEGFHGTVTSPSCQPVFEIHKSGTNFYMTIVAMGTTKPDTLAIELISNQRLVFLSEGKTIVFRKLIEQGSI